eukprot:15456948-Alexandrium_andersonii.AAC.1
MASFLPAPPPQCNGRPCVCGPRTAHLVANAPTRLGVAQPPPPPPWDITGQRIPVPPPPATTPYARSSRPEPWG